MRLLSLLCCLCCFACHSSQNLARYTAKVNAKLPGQTAPTDMIFVPGNGDIAPFYISVSEEPNINYAIYLLWLQSVFGESYPEVVKAALPQSAQLNHSDQYLDHFIDAYLSNPAYAYYPVTNLTWEQIDNYLSWKTDRLNECILIKNGILNFNPEQKDEDNFNTEAYLVGQYQGDVRKNISAGPYGGERAVQLNDGILFTGFRLPTEQEWDYVAQQTQLQKKKKVSTKKRVVHPYGEDYYTLLWQQSLAQGSPYYYDSSLPVGLNTYAPKLEPLYLPQRGQGQGQSLQNFPSIYDYAADSYGVINMKNGVREWLLDEYQTEVPFANKNWLEVLRDSDILINNPEAKDGEDRYIEKDSLGRMRNFRFIDIDPNGRPYEVERYHSQNLVVQKLRFKQRRIKARINKIKEMHSYQLGNKDLPKLAESLEKKREELIEKLKTDIPKITNVNQLARARQQLEALLNGNYSIAYRVVDYAQQMQELVAAAQAIQQQIVQAQNTYRVRQRVVKGGDWKSPGQQRSAKAENEAAGNIGFRVVLPYTGTPLLKAYKVNWNRKAPKLR